MRFLFVLLVFLSSAIHASSGDADADEPEVIQTPDSEPSYFDKTHVLRDSKELNSLELPASDDVKTSFKIIPLRNESLSYYLGDKVEVLLGFENTGTADLYITDVSGAFVSPYDNTIYVFNNTAVHHNITTKQHEYHSFYYPFHISPHSNPIDYGIVAFIYYVNARGDEYRSVVVNETLMIKDAPSAIKAGKFFLIMLLIGVVATLGIVFRKQIGNFVSGLYRRLISKSGGRRGIGRRTGRAHGAGAGDDDADEWIKNTSTHAFQKNEQREKEREKEKAKKSAGGKRDISQSPNPSIAGGRTKQGRSPPSDTASGAASGTGPFVLKNQ